MHNISYEEVTLDLNSSLRTVEYTQQDQDLFRGFHYHPEFELVFIPGGEGYRKTASSIARYENGDLVLVTPNMVHHCYIDHLHNGFEQYVVQFPANDAWKSIFQLQEFSNIQGLLNTPPSLIYFEGNEKHRIGERIVNLFDMEPHKKITALLSILHSLSSTDKKIVRGPSIARPPKMQNKLRIINSYIEANFDQTVCTNEIAAMLDMQKSSFCRFVKSATSKTFTEITNEYRVNRACELLLETEASVIDIAYQCGFNNVSHFNRQFRHLIDESPSRYREAMAIRH